MRNQLGQEGRFCFANVQPGLAELVLRENGDFLWAVVVPLLAGMHRQDMITVGQSLELSVNLAVSATAYQQLYSNNGADRYHPFDYVDVIQLGIDEAMDPLDFGIVGREAHETILQDRVYGLVEAAEFEPQIIAINAYRSQIPQVAPLLPRGFVEDLYYELTVNRDSGFDGMALDHALGALVVMATNPDEQTQDVEVKLWDASGQEITTGWYFGTTNRLRKAVFFNLDPGWYAAAAFDGDQVYAMDTTISDYGTVSYLELGGRVEAGVSP